MNVLLFNVLLYVDIVNDSMPLCKNEDVFSFGRSLHVSIYISQCVLVLVTESGSVTSFWDQSHDEGFYLLPYVPNDTLAATWEVSRRTDPHFVIITSNMTILITNGSQHLGSEFSVTKNESYLALNVRLTQEAHNKSLFMVDGVPQDVESLSKGYPWIIFNCTEGCISGERIRTLQYVVRFTWVSSLAAVSVAGSDSVSLLLGLLLLSLAV